MRPHLSQKQFLPNTPEGEHLLDDTLQVPLELRMYSILGPALPKALGNNAHSSESTQAHEVLGEHQTGGQAGRKRLFGRKKVRIWRQVIVVLVRLLCDLTPEKRELGQKGRLFIEANFAKRFPVTEVHF